MLFTTYRITGFVRADALFYLSSTCLEIIYIFEILFTIRWWYKRKKRIERRTWEKWKSSILWKYTPASYFRSYNPWIQLLSLVIRLGLGWHRFVHLPCPFILRFPPEFLRFSQYIGNFIKDVLSSISEIFKMKMILL